MNEQRDEEDQKLYSVGFYDGLEEAINIIKLNRDTLLHRSSGPDKELELSLLNFLINELLELTK